jgi:hypothetical protein
MPWTGTTLPPLRVAFKTQFAAERMTCGRFRGFPARTGEIAPRIMAERLVASAEIPAISACAFFSNKKTPRRRFRPRNLPTNLTNLIH